MSARVGASGARRAVARRPARALRASSVCADRSSTCGSGDSAPRERGGACSRTTWTLVPPMPTELTPARRGPYSGSGHGSASVTTWNGESSRASSGCARPAPAVGAMTACSSIRTVLMTPATPAAASRWPMFAFTEPSPMELVPRAPLNAAVAAVASMRSPSSVAVPCASRYWASAGSRPAVVQASTMAAVCWSTPGAVKPTRAEPSLVTALPRMTARTGSPSASASARRRSTTTPTPFPGTVPPDASSKGRQRPSDEKIPPW